MQSHSLIQSRATHRELQYVFSVWDSVNSPDHGRGCVGTFCTETARVSANSTVSLSQCQAVRLIYQTKKAQTRKPDLCDQWSVERRV